MNEKKLVEEVEKEWIHENRFSLLTSVDRELIELAIKKTRSECEKDYNQLKEDSLEQYATGCIEGAEQERDRIREDVEKKRMKAGLEWERYYNSAIDDVLKVLDKEEK